MVILDQAKNLLHNLQGFRVEKVSRSSNTAAHNLAKFGFRVWVKGCMFEAVPPCVEVDRPGVVENDVNSFVLV